MNYIIEKYIARITLNNINDFALKNNIILSEKEQKIFYNIVKNHWQELINGNDEEIIQYLKSELDENKFSSVITLYELYKEKYKNYL